MCFCRIIVRMANYNKTTQEIARPSDLLAGLRAYTTTLHSLSSYVNVDVSRLVKTVLLQQTQPVDSRGATTITTLYTNWCVEVQAVIYKVTERKRVSIHPLVPSLIPFLFSFFSCTSGIWRACCVRPAAPSSSTVLPCTASSTSCLRMNQSSKQRSFQIYRVCF